MLSRSKQTRRVREDEDCCSNACVPVNKKESIGRRVHQIIQRRREQGAFNNLVRELNGDDFSSIIG